MGRRRFTPEFKLEAVKLVRERGMTVRQAAADLGLHENVLRKSDAQTGRSRLRVVHKNRKKGRKTHLMSLVAADYLVSTPKTIPPTGDRSTGCDGRSHWRSNC